jgi:hypothetical protein
MKARLPNIDPANLAAGYGYMVAQALDPVQERPQPAKTSWRRQPISRA